MARTGRRIITLSLTLAALVGSGVAALVIAADPAGALTPGEGTGPGWCASYRGQNIGSYRNIYACKPHGKGAGKTPFDSIPGFQPTELANRFLFKLTGHTLSDNEVGGNYVALASATYAIPDSASGGAGRLPAPGDIISMWGGRSAQKQNGNRTLVAVVTGVAPTTSGWTVTTLNQGPQADSGPDGFDTINVSGGGRTWSTENGFYTAFDWLRLAGATTGTGPGGNPGSGSGHASGAWTAAQAPALPGSQRRQLLSVACGSAASCTAVGTSGQSGLLIAGSGRSWTASPVPVPATSATAVRLASVSCPSAAACVAVGDYVSSGQQQGLLLAGHGKSWTATRAPLPIAGQSPQQAAGIAYGMSARGDDPPHPANAAASPDANLTAVACPTASSCVAVGHYASAASVYPLVLTGQGSSWTARRAPLPSDAAAKPDAGLAGVACPGPGTCTAVGSYVDRAGHRQGLLVSERGGSWTAVRSPLPAGASVPGAALTAVSCPRGPGGTNCVTVGSFDGQVRGFVLTGSGTTWSAAQTPLPAGAGPKQSAAFRAVSCSASLCVAAGTYIDAAGSSQGLLVTRQGQKLTAAQAALPAGAAARQGLPGAQITSVACPAGSSCLAAGDYTDTAGDAQIVLLTGSSSAWKAARGPAPANARVVGSQAQGVLSPALLTSVSCPDVSVCVAVGSYPTRTVGTAGLVATGPA
jgi:hypothetical protein